jgi:hypothetical protein
MNSVDDWDSSGSEDDSASSSSWGSDDVPATANAASVQSVGHHEAAFIIDEKNLEDSIELSVKLWAQGKNIVDLLNSMTQVYQGQFPGLGDVWNSKYSDGSLKITDIRKAYL